MVHNHSFGHIPVPSLTVPTLEDEVALKSDYDYYTGQQQEYYRYFPEGVLYFPEDKTTYGFDQYFDRKPFTDLQYTVEDLANKYIQLSKYLYDEVGTVEL